MRFQLFATKLNSVTKLENPDLAKHVRNVKGYRKCSDETHDVSQGRVFQAGLQLSAPEGMKTMLLFCFMNNISLQTFTGILCYPWDLIPITETHR